VLTLKGKLRFTVSNGETFIIEPGIILIANDTKGVGHTWEIVDGNEWERIYIPLEEDVEDHFIAGKST
jgi:quercetin dioxygenase-like cupin family protein